MTKSKRCELVLNALFYWEPMEFFQKRCDMTTLRFIYILFVFKDKPRCAVLGLSYARDLLIGYTSKSSIAVVLSWRDHGCNALFCGTVRRERMDRRDSPECKKRSTAEATDVLFHWQSGQDALHFQVRNSALKKNATSNYICRLAADRTDTHWWTYKPHLSIFCVKL